MVLGAGVEGVWRDLERLGGIWRDLEFVYLVTALKLRLGCLNSCGGRHNS